MADDDLELAKMIKDTNHFIDRPAIDMEGAVKESDKVFANFLTNLKRDEWRKVSNTDR